MISKDNNHVFFHDNNRVSFNDNNELPIETPNWVIKTKITSSMGMVNYLYYYKANGYKANEVTCPTIDIHRIQGKIDCALHYLSQKVRDKAIKCGFLEHPNGESVMLCDANLSMCKKIIEIAEEERNIDEIKEHLAESLGIPVIPAMKILIEMAKKDFESAKNSAIKAQSEGADTVFELANELKSRLGTPNQIVDTDKIVELYQAVSGTSLANASEAALEILDMEGIVDNKDPEVLKLKFRLSCNIVGNTMKRNHYFNGLCGFGMSNKSAINKEDDIVDLATNAASQVKCLMEENKNLKLRLQEMQEKEDSQRKKYIRLDLEDDNSPGDRPNL